MPLDREICTQETEIGPTMDRSRKRMIFTDHGGWNLSQLAHSKQINLATRNSDYMQRRLLSILFFCFLAERMLTNLPTPIAGSAIIEILSFSCVMPRLVSATGRIFEPSPTADVWHPWGGSRHGRAGLHVGIFRATNEREEGAKRYEGLASGADIICASRVWDAFCFALVWGVCLTLPNCHPQFEVPAGSLALRW